MHVRLLVIEDEPRIADILKAGLERAGFALDVVSCCADAKEALALGSYDAAILDLGLPDGDGMDLLVELRPAPNRIPILILTARDAVESRVAGLNAGADDYLVKPFDIAEVVARTKALLRRPGGALGVALQAGNVLFDTIGRDTRIGGVPVQLPRRECTILEILLRRQGRVVPRSVLEERIYGIEDDLESNAVPVHVHHLRRRLQEANATAEIHTVRGVGYLLAEKKKMKPVLFRSLQLRLAVPLAALYVAATAIAVGVLISGLFRPAITSARRYRLTSRFRVALVARRRG
jgi:DNA-binding response OmpR family regulator